MVTRLQSKFNEMELWSDRRPLRLYDERLPPEPEYPSIEPSEADFSESDLRLQHTDGEDIKHAPPGSSAHIS